MRAVWIGLDSRVGRGGTMEHNQKLTSRAQQLRKNMTKEERKLWYEYLRNYPYQFRRQVAFGKYILDFYCAAAKLAIELDGSQHYEADGPEYDNRRTAFLNRMGISVLRFTNTDVMRNLSGVCQMIDMTVNNRILASLQGATSPAPCGGTLPKGEGN